MAREITIFLCGSGLNKKSAEKLETLSEIMNEFDESEENHTWLCIDGVGSEASKYHYFPALVNANCGEHSYLKGLCKAILFVRQAQAEFGNINVKIVGYSRGAALAVMLAKSLFDVERTRLIPVDIFALDPVPGPLNAMLSMRKLTPNIRNYCAFISGLEKKPGFSVCLPEQNGNQHTNYLIFDGLAVDHSGTVGLTISIYRGIQSIFSSGFFGKNMGAQECLMASKDQRVIAIKRAIENIIIGRKLQQSVTYLLENRLNKVDAVKRLYDYRSGLNPDCTSTVLPDDDPHVVTTASDAILSILLSMRVRESRQNINTRHVILKK